MGREHRVRARAIGPILSLRSGPGLGAYPKASASASAMQRVLVPAEGQRVYYSAKASGSCDPLPVERPRSAGATSMQRQRARG